jgi:pimeloyl-ACP methyl ester carboxylesterase
LVGSQLGSLNTLAYAKSHPEQVSQVVLVDPITQSMFEENQDSISTTIEKQQTSWKQFWMKKHVPFSRLLQTTAFLGINRIAILLGFLDVPGVNDNDDAHEFRTDQEDDDTNTDLDENDTLLSNMRLNHFMTDPSNLGAASAELGM